ncbi:hypothetical protein SSX86_003849 [Deinandra increscens subsp. villosa]|uniref:SWIM-type domain-containing protein n=1 Tax=Deinandra increscens subsp. villosa TaxID=3103831 RepID=A0AAP0HAC5_9ASTR
MDDFIPFKICHGGTFDEGQFPTLIYMGRLSYFCYRSDEHIFKHLLADNDVFEMVKNVHVNSNQHLELYIQNGSISCSPTRVCNVLLSEAQSTSPRVKAQPNVRVVNSGSDQLVTPLGHNHLVYSRYESDGVVNSVSESETEAGEDNSVDVQANSECEEYISDNEDDEWENSRASIQKKNEEDVQSKDNLLQLYEDSDGDINTPGESEDDDIRGKKYKIDVPVVNDQTDWKSFKWVAGIRFPTRDAFKESVRAYAVENGRNLIIFISDNSRQGRVGVKCVNGCPFTLYCSFHKGIECYMVKKAKNQHTCHRSMSKNRQLTCRFVATEFLPLFKARPNWPAKDIQDDVKEKYKVIINKWFAYNAKRSAHHMQHGSMKMHYGRLACYLSCLRNANPASTFNLVTAPPADPTSPDTFFRIYICFDVLKKGFMDGNDQMYPPAWAVVEGENNESWHWFMEELRKCVGVNDGGEGWTLVSDQQKGLLNVVCFIWPNAEHRNCARYIYANWHKTFKGADLKEAFWKAARSYNEADYNIAIEALKELSNDGYEAFIKQNPKCFVKCFLDNKTTSDVIVNNMAETFNGYILQSRSKHFIDMLEDIRIAIMKRLARTHQEILVKDFIVYPRIQMKLEKEKSWAYKCEVFPSYVNVFQVWIFDDVTVDLVNRTCTCKQWDLTGIPCKHVCAAVSFKREQVEDYVAKCFTKDFYMKAYEYTIPPLPSQKFWPNIECPLDPPPIKVQPGRPKKNRRRDPHEDPKKSGKLTKHGVVMTCSNYKEKGHNRRKCTKESIGEPVTKRPRGRPKKQWEEVTGPSDRGRGRGRAGEGAEEGAWLFDFVF